MKGTLLETISADATTDDGTSRGRSFLAAICALLIASMVVAGYFYLRKRHAQQTLLAAQAEQGPPTELKGPPKLQIFVDEAMSKGDQTLVGGTVRNISNESLSSLTVNLELIRRKGPTTEKALVQVQPSQLAPQEEGHYSLSLRSADYGSVKLLGLKGGAASLALAYISAPGQKRPAEKVEAKTIIVKRPSTPNNGFLNTPDNPSRVP
jgi:hypothetical protein